MSVIAAMFLLYFTYILAHFILFLGQL